MLSVKCKIILYVLTTIIISWLINRNINTLLSNYFLCVRFTYYVYPRVRFGMNTRSCSFFVVSLYRTRFLNIFVFPNFYFFICSSTITRRTKIVLGFHYHSYWTIFLEINLRKQFDIMKYCYHAYLLISKYINRCPNLIQIKK